MPTSTPNSALLLRDVRRIRLEEISALVFRVVNESEQTVGVCFEEYQFAGSMRKHFTDDNGDTFQRAAFGNTDGCFLIEKNGLEKNLETLNTVRGFFKIWHEASGHSERRADVRDTCARLIKLFDSISQTCNTLPYLQDVGRISEASQTAPDGEFQQVEDRLASLLRTLRAVDAGDGDGIISPNRFEQFLNTAD